MWSDQAFLDFIWIKKLFSKSVSFLLQFLVILWIPLTQRLSIFGKNLERFYQNVNRRANCKYLFSIPLSYGLYYTVILYGYMKWTIWIVSNHLHFFIFQSNYFAKKNCLDDQAYIINPSYGKNSLPLKISGLVIKYNFMCGTHAAYPY